MDDCLILIAVIGIDSKKNKEDITKIMQEYNSATNGINIDHMTKHNEKGSHSMVEEELIPFLIIKVYYQVTQKSLSMDSQLQ
jgi:hypothetical protein